MEESIWDLCYVLPTGRDTSGNVSVERASLVVGLAAKADCTTLFETIITTSNPLREG